VLTDLFKKELEEMWSRVACAFWAKTSREINPHDIKAKITGMDE
jgi:hypothetical protein